VAGGSCCWELRRCDSTSPIGDHEQGGAMQPRCHLGRSRQRTMFAASRGEAHAMHTTSSSSSSAEVATPPDEVATPPDEVATTRSGGAVGAAATLHTSAHLSLRDLRSPP
jgi:hypothetical protein